MKKIFKFLVPLSATMVATTPLMVSCGKYDLDWTYVDTDQSQHPFIPSTPEGLLPTGEKTWEDATKLYANAVSTNKIFMTDDFLSSNNELIIELVGPADKGSYGKSHLTFNGVSLDEETYLSPMVRLSFKFKIEMYGTAEQAGQKMEMKQIMQGDITNYPFFADYAAQGYWALKPNIMISEELTADTSWKFHYYGYYFMTGQTAQEIEATCDYTIGEASQEKKDEFADAFSLATFKSYYLSKLGYTPPQSSLN